jgi:hypothetical protein
LSSLGSLNGAKGIMICCGCRQSIILSLLFFQKMLAEMPCKYINIEEETYKVQAEEKTESNKPKGPNEGFRPSRQKKQTIILSLLLLSCFIVMFRHIWLMRNSATWI